MILTTWPSAFPSTQWYTDYTIVALGSTPQNKAPRECMVKYCPLRYYNTANHLLQYYPTLEDNPIVILNSHKKEYAAHIRT